MSLLKACLLALLNVTTVTALSGQLGQQKHIWEYKKDVEDRKQKLLVHQSDTDPSLLYPEHNISVPVDHFHNESRYEPHSQELYNMRYWFDASHYRKGGPVIVLQSGETDASERLPLLQKGIIAQLAQAANGIGVVIEHRYYGKSFPTADLSTQNLRFLSTEQAMADEAYFAQHIQFPGLEHFGDLSSNTTAYIAYGGSYAGTVSAFLRVVYPHVFWGAISSSGVTKAIYNYWHYFEAIAEYAPPACASMQMTMTHIVDTILVVKNHTDFPTRLKTMFGLPNVTHSADFAGVLISGLSHFQSMNWDPAISDPGFYEYCANLTSSDILYPDTEHLRAEASELMLEGGYSPTKRLTTAMLNYIGYINLTEVSRCASQNITQDECFSTYDDTQYQQDGLEQYSWRSWPYQYCTEFGYLMTADVPGGALPIISRTMDLDHNSVICRKAFNITDPPKVEIINKYGSYDISYPRLAMTGGEWDPWRPATPQAFENRTSTTSEPFIVMPAAVHHWDENGLFANETTKSLPPSRVAQVQKAEIEFVQAWMQEWQQQKFKDSEDSVESDSLWSGKSYGNPNFVVQTYV